MANHEEVKHYEINIYVMADFEIKNGVGIIPEGTTKLDWSSFEKCTELTSVVIPDSVTEISGSAFKGCPNLTSIVVSEGNTVYDSRNNCNAVIETETNTLMAGCAGTTIPKSVTKIERIAFWERVGMTSIIIPKSVTEIGDSAFEGCKDLSEIETDYFTTLPPAKFKKQWAYDEYYPSYYCLLSKDGDIREPELSSEDENDKPLKDNDSKTFTIEGETWEEKKVINTLEKQFKKLYPSRRLDVIEFEYEEGLEYYFNCLADDMNYQIMIDFETGNIYWDRNLSK